MLKLCCILKWCRKRQSCRQRMAVIVIGSFSSGAHNSYTYLEHHQQMLTHFQPHVKFKCLYETQVAQVVESASAGAHKRYRLSPWVGKISSRGVEGATHFCILAQTVPWTEEPRAIVHGVDWAYKYMNGNSGNTTRNKRGIKLTKCVRPQGNCI